MAPPSDSAKGGLVGRSESFNIEILHRCVCVSGELDTRTAPLMVDAVMALRDPVSVDLRDVTFIDSRGLQALLELRGARPKLRIVAISERVARLLAITDTTFLLRRLMEPDPSMASGIASAENSLSNRKPSTGEYG